MQQTLSQLTNRTRIRSRSLVWVALLLAVSGSFAVGLGYWETHRRRTQMQNDSRVARVWLAGTTFGKEHILTRGSTLQGWLNAHNISFLGNYEVIQSQFNGDPAGVELWFNYESYLVEHPELECHRLSPTGTAFTDDLGQPYHGYLDIHGKTIGVYLPGYDHAAKRLTCALHWVPRQPAPPLPVSNPMVFTVDLPPVKRILPSRSQLPPGSVTQTREGVTVTASAARLGAPKLGRQDTGQRDLTFRLKIEGGRLANDNVAEEFSEESVVWTNLPVLPSGRRTTTRAITILRSALSRQLQANQRVVRNITGNKPRLTLLPDTTVLTVPAPLTITDPYGMSLLVPQHSVTPLISKETVQSSLRGEGTVWVAPVNGAGHGTDVIKLHFDVFPDARGKGAESRDPVHSIPFDLLLPVQTGDEI